MTVYQAKSITSLSFEVTKDEKLIGKLSYKGWFKFDTEIEIADRNYQVVPKGFWETTIEVKDGEKVLMELKMNWSGNIVVQTYFNDEKGYVFSHKGIFKESFTLADHEGTELLVMKPQLKWSKLNYEYEITTSDIFETLSEKELLLMISLHSANYYMSMMNGY